MRIQHNIAALNSYRNLTTNNNAVSKNLEKLSSGYRINRAGDDAAGLAISEKMRAQITGLETAQKNANDGISLVQTAEGALTEVHSMLNRMVELATQSANGTYDNQTDRVALQEEVTSLLDEIDRISESTNYNGITLLDGSLGRVTSAADEIATGLKDIGVTDSNIFTHLADAAPAKEAQKGKFELNLSQLKVTNGSQTYAVQGSNVKITLGSGANAITLNGLTSIAVGSQLDKATVKAIEGGTADKTKCDFDASKISDGKGEVVDSLTGADIAKSWIETIKKAATETAGSAEQQKALKALGETVTETSWDPSTTATLTNGWGYDEDTGNVTAKINGITYNVTENDGILTFEMAKNPAVKSDIDADLKANVTVKGMDKDGNAVTYGTQAGNAGATGGVADPTGMTYGSATVSISQGEGIGVNIIQKAEPEGGRAYAQSEFKLDKLDIKDGTALKIGDETYIFAIGKDSEFKGFDNVIDLTDYEEKDANKTPTADFYKDAGRLLSMAAKDNSKFLVTTTNNNGTIRLTEREGGGIDYSVNDLVGDKTAYHKDAKATGWKNLIQIGKGNPDAKPAVTSGGLTLQIGDTADDFNQITVGIDSMAADALGIKSVDISTQEGAKNAIETIKTAVNSVSTQRGKLGAIQNRLEHTINNLSVTTENITAAESRIRDVDMAEEMMAYTKNNILVQASQAMLAQANQIPQGVLQLLQ